MQRETSWGQSFYKSETRISFPGCVCFFFSCLRSIGAPGLIGYDRRPVFTYPRYTMHMLEHVIVRAKITNSSWGNDIIPDNKLVEASAADAVR